VQPVFALQIYITVSLDLDERSAKRSRTADRSSSDGETRTSVTELIDYVGQQVASEAQRPPPLWEIYAEQPSVFECVQHQRREIAHRKAKRDDRSIPPIPKVVQGPHGGGKTGFLIVIDSLDFKAGVSSTTAVDNKEGGPRGPLWVHFERKFPSAISWEPRLRLETDPDTMAAGIFGPPETPTVLAERVDGTFLRIQRTEEMRSSLAMMYASSCKPSDPPLLVQDMMNVGWSEDEGAPDAELAHAAEDAMATIQSLAAGLSAEDYSVDKPSTTDIIISNSAGPPKDPDLRYVIYVPFLHQDGMGDQLEQVAKAFTSEITSRLRGEKKTVSFEFCKPPSDDLGSILAVHRETYQSQENYIGAFTTFPNDNDEESPVRIRAHPTARTEHAEENDPAKSSSEPYRTFAVVLESPDFCHRPGRVLFLLADGGKPKPDADRAEDVYPSMKAELQDYVEMELWRCAGMDEVARRLQMVWGGVKWEPGANAADEKEKGGDAEGDVK